MLLNGGLPILYFAAQRRLTCSALYCPTEAYLFCIILPDGGLPIQLNTARRRIIYCFIVPDGGLSIQLYAARQRLIYSAFCCQTEAYLFLFILPNRSLSIQLYSARQRLIYSAFCCLTEAYLFSFMLPDRGLSILLFAAQRRLTYSLFYCPTQAYLFCFILSDKSVHILLYTARQRLPILLYTARRRLIYCFILQDRDLFIQVIGRLEFLSTLTSYRPLPEKSLSDGVVRLYHKYWLLFIYRLPFDLALCIANPSVILVQSLLSHPLLNCRTVHRNSVFYQHLFSVCYLCIYLHLSVYVGV